MTEGSSSSTSPLRVRRGEVTVVGETPGARDWRLEIILRGDAERNRARLAAALDDLGKVTSKVLMSQHGSGLFVYAGDEGLLRQMRARVERSFARHAISATAALQCWDSDFTCWRQVDPPPPAWLDQAEATVRRNGEVLQTHAIRAWAGRLVQDELELSMLDWAAKLNLECVVVRHRHMLTTELVFTLAGAAHSLQRFQQALSEECRATLERARRGSPPMTGPGY